MKLPGRTIPTAIDSLHWFQKLFGFQEIYLDVPKKFQLSSDEGTLTSLMNYRSFPIGRFATISLGDLQLELDSTLRKYQFIPTKEETYRNRKVFPTFEIQHECISGILGIHSLKPNAVFQAASQFNCLEFPDPKLTPEYGITAYSNDPTQGPACAVACAAGTLYRNYFVPFPSSTLIAVGSNLSSFRGQSRDRQINTLDELEQALEDATGLRYWEIRNGYIFSSLHRLQALNDYFSFTKDLDYYQKLVKLGVQWDVGVTFDGQMNIIPETDDIRVTQVYCSAISCPYSELPTDAWFPIAKLTLEAMYEGTILTAVINMIEKEMSSTSLSRNDGNTFHREVYLTFIGGGVFGNRMEWIVEAMGKAIVNVERRLQRYVFPNDFDGDLQLRVTICHFQGIDRRVQESISQKVKEFSKK